MEEMMVQGMIALMLIIVVILLIASLFVLWPFWLGIAVFFGLSAGIGYLIRER